MADFKTPTFFYICVSEKTTQKYINSTFTLPINGFGKRKF